VVRGRARPVLPSQCLRLRLHIYAAAGRPANLVDTILGLFEVDDMDVHQLTVMPEL
jgi:hypothetical protein